MGESRDALVGSWSHAREDDTASTAVFRRSEAEFPPSRRPRVTIELAADGGLRRGDPAPDDGLTLTTGSWSLDGQRLTLSIEGRPEEHLQIETVDEQQLVLSQSR
jgi:hypothetical protein